MAHTFGTSSGQSTGTTNPIVISFTTSPGDTVLVVMLASAGTTSARTGGAPTYNSLTMTQAGSNQGDPAGEGVAELWYLLDPPIGTYDVSIPNAGSLTIRRLICTGRSTLGKSYFDAAGGSNGTTTNPTANVTTTGYGDIIFSVTFTGATTWAPSGRDGTQIQDIDNGANGMGYQYLLKPEPGTYPAGWTFGTIDDWGLCIGAFKDASQPSLPNNYKNVRVGNGMGTTEKMR